MRLFFQLIIHVLLLTISLKLGFIYQIVNKEKFLLPVLVQNFLCIS